MYQVVSRFVLHKRYGLEVKDEARGGALAGVSVWEFQIENKKWGLDE